ncbi:MAG: hypothetical protein [Microviridae sp.]|nr:MAG: hypothetical protein [Microviridae sp.]
MICVSNPTPYEKSIVVAFVLFLFLAINVLSVLVSVWLNGNGGWSKSLRYLLHRFLLLLLITNSLFLVLILILAAFKGLLKSLILNILQIT